MGKIENNFGGRDRERERTERAMRDRWMALVPRFMVDQEFPVRRRCTRFFSEHFVLPGFVVVVLLLLLLLVVVSYF